MKNLKTTCIVITTLIAVFFFGKWVNEVRPRYEWKESIDKVLIQRGNAVFFHRTSEYIYCEKDDFNNIETCMAQTQEDIDNNNLKLCIYRVCYKKEKIRTN